MSKILIRAQPEDIGTAYVYLPRKVLEIMGWKQNDILDYDIPTTHNTLIIFKKEAPSE